MKKWLIGLVMAVVLLTGMVYVLIPTQLQVSSRVILPCSFGGASRLLQTEAQWARWLPAQLKPAASDVFTYWIRQRSMNRLLVDLTSQEQAVGSALDIIPKGTDSVSITWQYAISTGWNPIKRLQRYRLAKASKRQTDAALSSLQAFSGNTENIYGFHIQRTTLLDTAMVATKILTANYPSLKEISTLVQSLKNYIALSGARESNYPMLNISATDRGYAVMAAIPTSRALPDRDNIFFKRMIVMKDQTLFTEVKGGPATIREASKAVEQYMTDYHLTSPVIPFQSLLTDRTKQADTAQWITRIFYPVM